MNNNTANLPSLRNEVKRLFVDIRRPIGYIFMIDARHRVTVPACDFRMFEHVDNDV